VIETYSRREAAILASYTQQKLSGGILTPTITKNELVRDP
jgi:hypothetical protein